MKYAQSARHTKGWRIETIQVSRHFVSEPRQVKDDPSGSLPHNYEILAEVNFFDNKTANETARAIDADDGFFWLPACSAGKNWRPERPSPPRSRGHADLLTWIKIQNGPTTITFFRLCWGLRTNISSFRWYQEATYILDSEEFAGAATGKTAQLFLPTSNPYPCA